MDRNVTSVSDRLVQTAAAQTNTDPLELPPLYYSIDPETLDALVHRMSDGEVCFQYSGHTFRVESSGAIHVADRPAASDAAEDVATEATD